MKVKTLLKEIQQRIEEYPDFEEWEVYTEQPELWFPPNGQNMEEYSQSLREEKIPEDIIKDMLVPIFQSIEKVDEMKKQGWNFEVDSEGDVFRDTGAFLKDGEEIGGTVGAIPSKKIFIINNNM